jgi:hypothetical protein
MSIINKEIIDNMITGVMTSNDVMKQLFNQLELMSGDKIKKVLYHNGYGEFSVGGGFKNWYRQHVSPSTNDIDFTSRHSKFREDAGDKILEYGKYILSQNPDMNELMKKIWPWFDKLYLDDHHLYNLKELDSYRVARSEGKYITPAPCYDENIVTKLETWFAIFGQSGYDKLFNKYGIDYSGPYSLILEAFSKWYNHDNDTINLKSQSESDIPDYYIEQLGLEYLCASDDHDIRGRSLICIQTVPYYVPYIIHECDGVESVIQGYYHVCDKTHQPYE